MKWFRLRNCSMFSCGTWRSGTRFDPALPVVLCDLPRFDALVQRISAMADPKDFLRQLEAEHKRQDQPTRGRRTNFFASGGSGWGNAYSGFRGAKRDRLTEDWNPQSLSPGTIHRMDGEFLRRRARDLYANDTHGKSAVDAYVANVIECGITPKPLFDDPGRRQLWLDEWNRWGQSEADITGQQQIYELMCLWFVEVLVGGGCLLRMRTLPRRDGRQNGAALELFPEERFADDKDTFLRFQASKKSSNPITRGIEFDSATGRPIAFWVNRFDPNDSDPSGDLWEPMRIPATEARYAFFRNRIGQYRGHTVLAAAVIMLWKLGYYLDNEMMASAIKSLFAAAIKTENADWDTLTDEDASSTTDEYGNTLEKLQPAMIARLKPGEDIVGIGPNTPGGDSSPWLELIQRSIAVGSGLSYEEVIRDYSKGNFSSTRAAANSDRKRFRPMQKFVINNFCWPVYSHWAKGATFAGIDGFPTRADFVANMNQWLECNWRPPGWVSVNPLDDARANEIRLKDKTISREEIIAQEGGDWEEKFEQIDREYQRAQDLSFDIDAAMAQREHESDMSENQMDSGASDAANE